MIHHDIDGCITEIELAEEIRIYFNISNQYNYNKWKRFEHELFLWALIIFIKVTLLIKLSGEKEVLLYIYIFILPLESVLYCKRKFKNYHIDSRDKAFLEQK